MATNKFGKLTVAVIVLAGALSVPIVLAQEPRTDPRSNVDKPAQDPPRQLPPGFVPVEGAPAQDQIPAAPLVISAYAVAWLVVFVYLASLWQRLGRIERELAEVTRRVEAGGRR
jgi:CcmD family protein